MLKSTAMNHFSKYLVFLSLSLITLIGVFLRFYNLSSIPSGLYVDEAAIGYNAYSVMKTGRDEYGKFLPIFLRSFNAYSSPLYMYVSIIPIFLGGLEVLTTRFSSAISGSISILVIYYILSNFKPIKSRLAILLGTLLFAISPWSIFFSRGAFEANMAFLFFCISVLLIIKAKEKHSLFILVSILLGISTYAYQSNRLISILVLFFSSFWVFEHNGSYQIRNIFRKEMILGGIIFSIIQIPQLVMMLEPAFSSRASGLFYGDVIISQANKIPFPRSISYFLSLSREFASQFFAYLSPRNLFSLPSSDKQRSIPELGVLYFWMIIPYFLGIYLTFELRKNKYIHLLIMLLIVTITPAALTKDPFSTLRSLNLLLPLTILITLGLDFLLNNSRQWKIVTLIALSILVPVSLLQLWRSYFVLLPSLFAKNWDYGYESLASEISARPYTHFLIDESRNNPSYIKLAFFLTTDPYVLQSQTKKSIKDNYYGGESFDSNYLINNIEIGHIVWEEDIYHDQIIVGDSLSISDQQAVEHYLDKMFEILDPLRSIIFVGYKTNPHKKCEAINFKNSNCNFEESIRKF